MCDFSGSEHAWDRFSFETNSAACNNAIVLVLKAAEEAVLCVGALCRVDLHIAMFCVWCCICSVSSVAEEQPARRHGAVSTWNNDGRILHVSKEKPAYRPRLLGAG